ncbi:MAG TPA: enamine deaminase RidA [Gammaproteobacteria bacterium]|jgi:enamine deaminase RidA (YjgF/YER057c/UK114 family)|nr:enamine deaminase RidA [Acidiferrobacteraceae bacterium]MDP6399560.1 RidA family protein [Arenicellales bacterium]HCX86679.1 enamine deaminase RidA [Gammaproteobacteria bacterium]MDP6552245.1 RidA family protein [Arenicellales bacterium]MDP6790526.1 RidA family protein [Arenicellales bacterium]|tara:strand:- start:7461 stop:7853 length:393 start_codon:yes stop_codon:yes gene_type:complete
MKTVQPPGWPRPKGYANGVLAQGQLLFIAGQVGWDESETFLSERFSDQVEQALKNVVAVLTEAGALPEHITRMTWYVTDKQEYLAQSQAVGEAYRSVIGPHYPAMSLVEVAGLVEEGGKVEIEATAVIPE